MAADATVLFHTFFLSNLIATVIAAELHGATTRFRRIEYLPSIPSEWTQQTEAPDPSATINFGLAIQDDDKIERLHETVLRVSTPGQELYGQHLTRDELRDLVEPDPEALDRISK